MAGVWTQRFSFATGCVVDAATGCLALVDDTVDSTDVPHTLFAGWYSGKWRGYGDAPWSTVAMASGRFPEPYFAALGPAGQVRIIRSSGTSDEQIQPTRPGPFRCLRLIGDQLFAAGMERKVLRRDGANRWTALDQGLRPPGEQVAGFEALDGFDKDDIYAVGWNGEICWFNRGRWRGIDSPTNVVLTAVCCADDGWVYVAGQGAVLLRGRGDEWHVIEHELLIDNIWQLEWFANKLQIATLRGVYTLEANGSIAAADFGSDLPLTSYRFAKGQNVLWSIGPKDVLAFDGTNWLRID